jgi:hypothetical protein
MSFVALATCKNIPEPDVDEPLLVAALERAGVAVRVLAWDDESVDWTAPTLTVIRSTWNYYLRPSAFLAWAREQGARLLNSPDIVVWNHHKEYLRALEKAGLRIIPGLWFRQHSSAPFAKMLTDAGWNDVVIKPTIAAGSYKTTRLKGPRFDDELTQALVDEGDMVMQPYIASVETYGERSIVWIDGEITHSVRKSPRFKGGQEVVSGAVAIADEERQLATAALASTCIPGAPLYARVDMVRDAEGRPMLSELELMEPSLFLRESPLALERFVSSIARRFRT